MTEFNIEDILGPFPGSDLDDTECTVRALRFIKDPKILRVECSLYESKWFDVRRIHFTKATYYFAECYSRAYQRAMRVRYDLYRSRHMRGIKCVENDFFALKRIEYVGLWKGRQMADKLGIPYDFYCHRAMEYAEEFNWRYMPRPTQIFGDDIHCYIQQKWVEEISGRIWYAEHPYYAAENYVGSVDQGDYHRYLAEVIKMRQHPKFALHHVLKESASMPVSVAQEMFDLDLINSALAL